MSKLKKLGRSIRLTIFAIASVVALCAPAFSQQTWYVRSDGGTRYSTNQTQGQCDGKADAAYPGTGTNQHCAFNDVRYLWTDGTYTADPGVGAPAWGWIGAGGDTYLIRGGPWRVGQSGPNSSDYLGLAGNPYGAGAPPPPSGTATQHTRILGENFANCGSQSSMTQIFGGYGVFQVIALNSAKYVDMQCIELTRHSQCVIFGIPPVPGNCKTDWPLDDYAKNGITTDTGTHDVLLQDMWIHGFNSRGIIGPIGGTVTATRVDIAYNGGAGWDFDDGAATPSVNGMLVADGLIVEWNGCNQAYPGTRAVSCYGQSSGGYGDGIGTPAGTCISTNVTNSIFRYNTQDGYDWLHNDTGVCPSSVTNSMSYGNNGSQFKWGAANNPMVFTNNIAIANCLRLSAPMTGQPSTYDANLQDYCRAYDAIAFDFRDGNVTTMTGNTIITYSPTTFDIDCPANNCVNSTFTFSKNIVLGYDNPGTYNLGGQPGGPGSFYFGHPIGNVVRSNNVYFGMRTLDLLPTEQVADPNFVGEPKVFNAEANLDVFTTGPLLPSGSPFAGLGATVNSTGGGSTGGGSTGGGSTGGGSTGGGSTGGSGSTGGGTTTPPPPPPTAPVCPAGFAPATITLGLTSYTFCAFSQ